MITEADIQSHADDLEYRHNRGKPDDADECPDYLNTFRVYADETRTTMKPCDCTKETQ